MAYGRPRMKRPDAREDSEAEIKEDEGEPLLPWRQGPWLHEGHDVEAMQPRGHREIDDSRQDEGAPCQDVKEKLECPVLLPGRPQTAMSGYIGKSETSNQTKRKKRSMLMKKPKTPRTNTKTNAKNSFTRPFISHMVKTPVK